MDPNKVLFNDEIEIPINKETGVKFTSDEIWALKRKAISLMDATQIGIVNDVLHVRNSDQVVFQDITVLPSKSNILKKRIESRQPNKLKRNKGFKPGFSTSKKKKNYGDDRSIKILTYEEYLERERKKKEDEEKEALERERKLAEIKAKINNNDDSKTDNTANNNDTSNKNNNDTNNNSNGNISQPIKVKDTIQTLDDYSPKKKKPIKRKTSF